MKSKILKSLFLSLCVILVFVICCFIFFKPKNIFVRKLGFKLPSSAELINYKYVLASDSLYIKTFFPESDFTEIRDGLDRYYESFDMRQLDSESYIPNFANTAEWWDMGKGEIVTGYYAVMDGSYGAKTRNVYSFITKNDKGEYFLYCSH